MDQKPGRARAWLLTAAAAGGPVVGAAGIASAASAASSSGNDQRARSGPSGEQFATNHNDSRPDRSASAIARGAGVGDDANVVQEVVQPGDETPVGEIVERDPGRFGSIVSGDGFLGRI